MTTPPIANRELWGIDIGGTKVVVAIGDATGTVHFSGRFPADRDESPEHTIDRALGLLAERSTEPAGPSGIGVSCPGPFDRSAKRFCDTPNMPRWQGFEIGAYMANAHPAPCKFMNDANAAALAEHRWGAGKGTASMLFLTMSTGFGAGLVLDGRVYQGPRGFAGEVGRIQLADDGPIGFGAAGTVEGFLSGPGIEQQARSEALACAQRGEPTALLDACAPLTCERLCAIAEAGDAAALRVTNRVADRLGQLIGLLANVLEPQMVVLGTIGEAHPKLFIQRATEHLERCCVRETLRGLTIVPGALGSLRPALASISIAMDEPK